MAKDKRVVYTLAIENDPGAKRSAEEQVANFRAIESAAKAATKAANEARTAITQANSATRGVSSFAARSMTGGAASSAVSASATGPARAVRESERAINRELDAELRERAKLFERERKLSTDRVRANVAASKAVRDAARAAGIDNDRRRLGIDPSAKGLSDSDAKRHVDSLGRQYAQLEAVERQRATASSKAWKEAGTATIAATHGVIQYGRALALIAASDEESAQRMVQKLAKFEAFASVLTGTIQIVKSGTSAWRAYQAAALAAAAANTAANAAGRGAVASRAAGGVVGGMIGGVGTGAAVGGAVAAGKAALVVAGGALVAGTVYFSMAAIKAAAEGKNVKEELKRTASDLWEGITEFSGLSDRAGDAAKAWKERWANVSKEIRESMQAADVRARGTLDVRAANRDIVTARASIGVQGFAIDREALTSGKGDFIKESHGPALAEAQARRKSADANLAIDQQAMRAAAANRGIGGIAEAHEASLRFRASATEAVEASRQVLSIEQQIKREQIDAARATWSGLQDRKRELQQILKEEEKSKMSAAARFGAMSDSEQQKTLEAARAFKEGKNITRDKEDLIGSLGGSAADIADASRSKRAFATPGFKELIADPIFQPKITTTQKAIADITTNINNQFTIALNAAVDYDKLGDQFKTKIVPLLEQSKQENRNALDRAMAELRMERALTEAQSGG